jgi:hypothetical protein
MIKARDARVARELEGVVRMKFLKILHKPVHRTQIPLFVYHLRLWKVNTTGDGTIVRGDWFLIQGQRP